MKEKMYFNQEELEDELNIDIKKIFFSIWSRKWGMLKIGIAVFLLIVLSTFFTTKKYVVDSDLYINKTNSSNMAEINPYFISEVGTGGGLAAMMAGGGNLMNELEIMQSPLVIDKVIEENHLVFKPLFGFIPTVKTGKPLTTEKFLKKKVKFEIKKGTNVVTVSYKDKDKELAYNIVNSIITNYVQLHKDLNSGKSKSDLAVLESEYNKTKADLEAKMKTISGMPAASMTGSGNLAALSAFSSSARKALSGIQGQYSSGLKSEIALREETEKVSELAKRLEWAKLVDNMSESSNVVILKEPRHLKDYEQKSPKLFTNIILGIVFGIIAALIALIYKELTDKKLSYSMLGDEIIYNLEKDFSDLKLAILSNQDKRISLVLFENIPTKITEQLKEFNNISAVQADISKEFITNINDSSEMILFATIGQTDSKKYKQTKQILENMKKKIVKEVLI